MVEAKNLLFKCGSSCILWVVLLSIFGSSAEG